MEGLFEERIGYTFGSAKDILIFGKKIPFKTFYSIPYPFGKLIVYSDKLVIQTLFGKKLEIRKNKIISLEKDQITLNKSYFKAIHIVHNEDISQNIVYVVPLKILNTINVLEKEGYKLINYEYD